MTQSIYTQWDNSWTTTSINSTSISSSGTATTAAISNDTKSGTEVAVTVAMGTGSVGVNVYVLREVNGSYEDPTVDRPWGFMMPYNASTTQRRAFVVLADRASNFKIHLVNNDSSSVTATVAYKQSTIESA